MSPSQGGALASLLFPVTTTITLDHKARGRFRRFGGKPGQKFIARMDGPSIVLEPAETEEDGNAVWKPTLALADLYRKKAKLPEGPGQRMGAEKVRNVGL